MSDDRLNLRVLSYELLKEQEDGFGGVTLERVHGRRDGPDRWAVRWKDRCLNRDGMWEWEPIPSSRDGAFLLRCRFESAMEGYRTWVSRLGGEIQCQAGGAPDTVEREAFRAGFCALLEREGNVTTRRWIFDGKSIAHDLEPSAWIAWQEARQNEGHDR